MHWKVLRPGFSCAAVLPSTSASCRSSQTSSMLPSSRKCDGKKDPSMNNLRFEVLLSCVCILQTHVASGNCAALGSAFRCLHSLAGGEDVTAYNEVLKSTLDLEGDPELQPTCIPHKDASSVCPIEIVVFLVRELGVDLSTPQQNRNTKRELLILTRCTSLCWSATSSWRRGSWTC